MSKFYKNDTLKMVGKFKEGSGAAHSVFESDSRIKFMREVFGCQMHGTFNVKVPRADFDKLVKYPATYTAKPSPDVKWWFFLCLIKKGPLERMAWGIHWIGPNKNKVAPRVEFISKELLPEEFRDGNLELEFFRPWTDEEVETFVTGSGFPWFQTFPWSPNKADSQLVWNTVKGRVVWAGKAVYEIGPHSGYYCCRASQIGAHVYGYDKNKGTTEFAKAIARHIERQDVEYLKADTKRNFDTILYLSVHHQFDPQYASLALKIDSLKARCKDLFVELIVPSLSGGATKDDVSMMVGEAPILVYKHRVRQTRAIYHLKGKL